MSCSYFLYGDDYESIRTRLIQITNELSIHNDSTQTIELYNAIDIESFYNQGTNLNMFSINSASVIRINIKIFKILEKEFNDFISYLNSVSKLKNIFLILKIDNYDKSIKTFISSSKLVNELCKSFQCEEHLKLKYWQVNEIRAYVNKIAEANKIKFQSDALDDFVDSFKEQTENIPAEIIKLQTYRLPDNTISQNLVNNLYSSTSNIDILFNSLISKKDDNQVEVIESINNIQNPLYVIAALQNKARYYYLLALCQEVSLSGLEIQKITGVHPYRAQKDISFVKNTSTERLLNIIKILSEVECKLKTGNCSPGLAVQNIFLKSNCLI
ncbi:MAG: hypothetical protein A3B68_05905 [Candidatus Melainabacteria bacterium RIFCSPHIGHO2_02_FULL_34_12]|nr:MAG: hypothetical protein A3B68_05905 [Candidatus Melainabacteria bacterium RIFCSPHIGHO2_02_FULL_34_12]